MGAVFSSRPHARPLMTTVTRCPNAPAASASSMPARISFKGSLPPPEIVSSQCLLLDKRDHPITIYGGLGQCAQTGDGEGSSGLCLMDLHRLAAQEEFSTASLGESAPHRFCCELSCSEHGFALKKTLAHSVALCKDCVQKIMQAPPPFSFSKRYAHNQ